MIIEIRFSRTWTEKIEGFCAQLPLYSYSYGDYGSHSILLRAADRLKVIIRDKELIPIVIYSLGNSLGKEEEINLECILESYNPPFELSEFLLYHHLVEIYLCLGAPAVSV